MSLIDQLWMPVRHRHHGRIWISPTQLSDPDVLAFDADRGDFNGALAQFSIGLLQTTTPVNSPIAWRKWLDAPPDAATLAQWFQPVREYFRFDGEGARFMQDYNLRADTGDGNDIAALLIETPGESTLKNNGDLFVKRNHVQGLCPHCAALALFCLQVNAPSGGAGHRTGLRGGGPLTTLLVMGQDSPCLWHDLWLNVRERDKFLEETGANPNKRDAHFIFPWLAGIDRIQSQNGQTTPVQVHPFHVFWAMPRRIRLEMENLESGDCDLCGRSSSGLIRHFFARPHGLNYKGAWQHPLSPCYENKGEWLPVHPQPGGIGYRYWLPWVLGMSTKSREIRPAHTVAFSNAVRQGVPLRLWAYGFDMDNMKARCWYEATLPLYELSNCNKDACARLQEQIGYWLAGADLAVFFLRSAVKGAWFNEARGDFSMVDASFWSHTEASFYTQLKDLIGKLRTNEEIDVMAVEIRAKWREKLSSACIDLFDRHFVGSGQIERQNPRRVAQAYRQLKNNLHGEKIHRALGLELPENNKKSASKRKARASVTTQGNLELE
ncbi:MAG: type I-E CRISPR-associated protein Cse1/CasA [Azoarcus sp.]|jgi:CRISPR system Cascade subunit CasA|nr:type I-E CRISPR-associated protein Cse1/CasA [Azoarcus sp.]